MFLRTGLLLILVILLNKVKFGIYIANHGITGNPQDYINLAKIGEECGWDGFFFMGSCFSPMGTRSGRLRSMDYVVRNSYSNG